MARYIDADNLIEHLEDNVKECGEPDVYAEPITYGSILGLKCVLSYAQTLPTADVVEVKHGEWKVSKYVFDNNGDEFPLEYACSLCGKGVPFHKTNYCSNCGAKMDGRSEDNA